MDGLVGISKKEESILLEASYKPLEEDGMLWEKNGVCYARQAALQTTLRELQHNDVIYHFDGT